MAMDRHATRMPRPHRIGNNGVAACRMKDKFDRGRVKYSASMRGEPQDVITTSAPVASTLSVVAAGVDLQRSQGCRFIQRMLRKILRVQPHNQYNVHEYLL